MRYDAGTDKYVAIPWGQAFREIGEKLKEIRARDPQRVVFYASGRASLETSFLYSLFARVYGNNNLPDSSNMCHETTSVGLPKSIGSPVGTVLLKDFEETDLILTFGQNVGTNSPRMLHELQRARRRGIGIVTFNPLRERGWERFKNPQEPKQMLGPSETKISTQYHQVNPGGDIAACFGIARTVFRLDDEAKAAGRPRVLDTDFVATHTHGFAEFERAVREKSWEDIEKYSGLNRAALEEAGTAYAEAKRCFIIYGMGITQHVHGMDCLGMLVNLLLMRGNIGRPGSGICPVRGHSNVQGQRTVGITEKPELVPNGKLRELFGFEPPMKKGLNTVEACEAILGGRVDAFIGLGGNFVRAVPDTDRMEAAWTSMDLTVQVATKLNRSHLINGKAAYLMPCIARSEIDRQNGEPQAVSMEDSTTCIHGSWGQVEPISEHLMSEPRIVAEMAKATLPPNPKLTWDKWAGDYASVRDTIESVYPEPFKDFNKRLWQPGGFPRPVPARERKWNTPTKKANFLLPEALTADGREADGEGVLRLVTIRSTDQFNTTSYGFDERFRGIKGSRHVVLMNEADMAEKGFSEGDAIALHAVSTDNVPRSVGNLKVVRYNIPKGSIAGYYPECNPLIPLDHYARESKVPAAKSLPVMAARQ